MATDRDDEVARRYRALASEEPPGHLDAAILARSRRAVGARPGGLRRWGPPLSIAAVLVLASGVVIRMQAEKPGIETAAPVREEAPPEREKVAPAASPTVPASPALPASPAPSSVPEARTRSLDSATRAAKQSAPPPAPEQKRARRDAPARPPAAQDAAYADHFVPEPARKAAKPEPVAPTEAPAMRANVQPQTTLRASTSPPPAPPAMMPAPAAAPPAPAAGAATLQAPESRLKADALDKRGTPLAPEAALDRIARLRAEGRDDEADQALEAFRRDFPDYRLDDAQWERVRRRAR